MNVESPVQTTAFQARVYDLVRRIPRGSVATYGGIARGLGCRSAQAVGQALRCNPFAPAVPCHRVIRTDLTLGGFSGETEGEQITRKIAMLKEEGVRFNAEGRLLEPQRVWEPH